MGTGRGFWGVVDEILYARKKLPVWAVVRRSYGYVWRHRALLALPLGLLLVAQMVVPLISLGVMAASRRMGLVHILFDICWSWLALLLTLSFTVGLHRTVLLDEMREGAAFLRFDRYLWNSVKTALLALLAAATLSLIFIAALVLPLGTGNLMVLFLLHPFAACGLLLPAWLAASYVGLRISLAFPAAALGYRSVFFLSWRISQGNVLRLFATALLVYLPFLLPGLLLLPAFAMAASLGPLSAAALAVGLVWLVVGAVLGAVSLSILTVAVSLNFFFLFKQSDEFGDV